MIERICPDVGDAVGNRHTGKDVGEPKRRVPDAGYRQLVDRARDDDVPARTGCSW